MISVCKDVRGFDLSRGIEALECGNCKFAQMSGSEEDCEQTALNCDVKRVSWLELRRIAKMKSVVHGNYCFFLEEAGVRVLAAFSRASIWSLSMSHKTP